MLTQAEPIAAERLQPYDIIRAGPGAGYLVLAAPVTGQLQGQPRVQVRVCEMDRPACQFTVDYAPGWPVHAQLHLTGRARRIE